MNFRYPQKRKTKQKYNEKQERERNDQAKWKKLFVCVCIWENGMNEKNCHDDNEKLIVFFDFDSDST